MARPLRGATPSVRAWPGYSTWALAFTRSRRAAELVALRARAHLVETHPELARTVAAYRGGLLAEERRELERGLASGALRGVATTSALELGIDLGGDALREQAEAFGFDTPLRIPLRVEESTVPADLNPPQSAQAAIGQFDVRVTPLQVAMVSAAVARRFERSICVRMVLARYDTTRTSWMCALLSKY